MKKTTNLVWGGRFEYDSSDILKRINNSISFDYNLAYQDIKLKDRIDASDSNEEKNKIKQQAIDYTKRKNISLKSLRPIY